MNGLWANQG